MQGDPEAPVTGGSLRLFALAALASKHEPSRMLTTVLSGQRLCRNADEARGSFVTFVREARPDFSIDEILCAEVPAEMVLKAAGALR